MRSPRISSFYLFIFILEVTSYEYLYIIINYENKDTKERLNFLKDWSTNNKINININTNKMWINHGSSVPLESIFIL